MDIMKEVASTGTYTEAERYQTPQGPATGQAEGPA